MGSNDFFLCQRATFNFTQGYLKAPKMEFVNGTVNLSDGSMLDATTSISLPLPVMPSFMEGENTSMIKSPVITRTKVSHPGDWLWCDGR